MALFQGRDFSFKLGERTYLMGILNFTPDSLSGDGLLLTPEKAFERALQMQEQGADILDIGAESTSPKATAISQREEEERLIPLLELLRGKLRIPISIDTYNPLTARSALEHGAHIINDVSGVFDPDMAAIVQENSAGWIVMHNDGGARAENVHYEGGVSAAVRRFFEDFLEKAVAAGIKKEQLCFDPGIGFGKSQEENLELLRSVPYLKIEDVAFLMAASRKRVIGYATGEENPALRDPGTVAAHTVAVAGGADFIRSHDVAGALQGARIADSLCRKTGGAHHDG